MKKYKAKILLVEDDPNLSLILVDYLELLTYETILCKDGVHGLSTFKSTHFDLCLLDVMMPKKDGFTLAEDIRKLNQEVPIVFLTAKSLKEDRIRGFKIGCDDYITKPFSTEELSLRIDAILKRCMIKSNLSLIEKQISYNIGSFVFDYTNMTLVSPSTKYNLTRKEVDLLKLLCDNKNLLLKRETALKTIWGDDNYFIGRSMDVFITKLRKYLKEDPNISITNVHGAGFKLEIDENNPLI
ncbi:MAG: response regulator transcription factor [Bacteroidetes bacterium]|nr:response regulator transcription factor [Bacteroidota bacterium]